MNEMRIARRYASGDENGEFVEQNLRNGFVVVCKQKSVRAIFLEDERADNIKSFQKQMIDTMCIDKASWIYRCEYWE